MEKQGGSILVVDGKNRSTGMDHSTQNFAYESEDC
jgi:hypothetical protein